MRILFCIAVLWLTGCASSQGNWGKNAFFVPSGKQIERAAKKAITDTKTWAPVLGAVAFSIDDFDQQVSDWAVEKTPLFGSVENAQQASDDMLILAKLSYWLSAMAADTGTQNSGYNRFQGLAIGHMAVAATHATTSHLKSLTDRTRPSGSSDRSFPSGHTSNAAVFAAVADHPINHSQLSYQQKMLWQWSNHSLAWLTGWARVEGQKHYPSDVLFGYALGNFIGQFFSELFLSANSSNSLHLQYVYHDGVLLLVRFDF